MVQLFYRVDHLADAKRLLNPANVPGSVSSAVGCDASTLPGGMIAARVTDKIYKPLSQTRPTTSVPGEPLRIGRYIIERRLGEGGMGVVYAARDDRLQRTTAVKTLSSIADDDTARERLRREARAAASVNHPNICQIYEVGDDDGRVFIAMELLDGEALSDRLHRGALIAS